MKKEGEREREREGRKRYRNKMIKKIGKNET